MKLLIVLIVMYSLAASEDCNAYSRRYRAEYFSQALDGYKFDIGSEVKYKWVRLLCVDELNNVNNVLKKI